MCFLVVGNVGTGIVGLPQQNIMYRVQKYVSITGVMAILMI